MFELTKRLIDSLNLNKIQFCHWKSNVLLNEALAGYDDLDLLVNRTQAHNFESIILKLGFKEAANKTLSFQGVKHFYGFDKNSGEILHLHVYYQIKTGPSWTKFLRLDIEDYVFENLERHDSGIMIPAKHIELVVFVFRVLMKNTKLNEYLLLTKEKERIEREIIYLSENCDQDKLEAFLKLFFKGISLNKFRSYLEIISNASALRRYYYALDCKRRLRKYIYQGELNNILSNINQAAYRIFNRLFWHQKKILGSGGMIIVITGLDATGKSTLTCEINKWLGGNFSTALFHFGKPPATLISFPIRLLIWLSRVLNPKSGSKRISLKSNGHHASLFYAFRQVVLAYERYHLSRKIWRKASYGSIVICDRYKSESIGVMDSCRLSIDNFTGLKRMLAKLENKFYRLIHEPDLMLNLTVPIEVAVLRNEKRIKQSKNPKNS